MALVHRQLFSPPDLYRGSDNIIYLPGKGGITVKQAGTKREEELYVHSDKSLCGMEGMQFKCKIQRSETGRCKIDPKAGGSHENRRKMAEGRLERSKRVLMPDCEGEIRFSDQVNANGAVRSEEM